MALPTVVVRLLTAFTVAPAGCWRTIAALVAVATLSACSSAGPGRLRHDRINYNDALSGSWKQQALLNIVRLRYADIPEFLDVTSVIGSYTLEGQLNAGASGGFGQGFAQGTYTDRPTITYTPLIGDKFTKSLLRPIPPAAIFALIQAGYPVDRVLQFTVRAINGVYNRSAEQGRSRPADPQFYALLDALRRIQLADALAMRLEPHGNDEKTVVFFRRDVPEEVAADLRFVAAILQINLQAPELQLTYSALATTRTEIALLTRSMLEIYAEIASTIEVPEGDVREGRAAPTPALPSTPHPRDLPMVQVLSGDQQPDDAFVAVRYRKHWFWMDDRDLASKFAFSSLMLFASLAETGVSPQAPLVTIPAN